MCRKFKKKFSLTRARRVPTIEKISLTRVSSRVGNLTRAWRQLKISLTRVSPCVGNLKFFFSLTRACRVPTIEKIFSYSRVTPLPSRQFKMFSYWCHAVTALTIFLTDTTSDFFFVCLFYIDSTKKTLVVCVTEDVGEYVGRTIEEIAGVPVTR